jgi:hypothetical protein
MKLPRRSLLKALGAFASLPLGRMLVRSEAQAQGMPAPLRFIGVYHPHGISADCYARRAGETDTTFSLSFTDSALAPLSAYASKLITFEGVDLAVAERSGTSGHGAAVCLFTGSETRGADHVAQSASLEQHLARTLGLGAGTPFPTVNLGVGSLGDANQDAIAHGPGGATIFNQLDPQVVFDQLFGNRMTGGNTAAADAARRRGQSVIDFVRGDLNSLSARLGATEKLKLDQHLSSLRDIETRLATVAPMTSCTVPARPVKTEFPKVAKYNGGEPYFDRIADLQVDLLAQAIACDVTRFATLFFDDPGKPTTVDGTLLPTDVHNEVAHTYTAGGAASVRLGRLNRYYYAKLARLLQRLDVGGVLDSTLVLAGSDMGNPAAHSTRNIPLVLAGGANGRLTMGRRLVAGADCPPGNPYCASPTLTPHNRVLVSIAKLFGDTRNTFGVASDAALITGGYPGL